MPLFILSVLIQVALVVHIVKTGRSQSWIWIVVTLPLAGSIAYFLIEVLPELRNTKTGRTASRKVQEVIDPNRKINQAARQYSRADTVENSMRLAEECYQKGMFEQAKDLYQQCLQGQHSDDPYLLFGKARCDFELANFGEVRRSLDTLIAHNPDYKNQDAHLLYARALEKLGEIDSARHEFEVLHSYFSGPQASYFYGKFLQAENEPAKAIAVFRQIMSIAESSDPHYTKLHQACLNQVRAELK